MTQEDIDLIKPAISRYKEAKGQTKQKISEIHEALGEGRLKPEHLQVQEDYLWKELINSDEREKFIELADRATNDGEFERIFSMAFGQVFLGWSPIER